MLVQDPVKKQQYRRAKIFAALATVFIGLLYFLFSPYSGLSFRKENKTNTVKPVGQFLEDVKQKSKDLKIKTNFISNKDN